jgi:hypothetical protein
LDVSDDVQISRFPISNTYPKMVESIEGDNLYDYPAKIHYLNQDELQLTTATSVFAELTIL